MNSAGSHAIFSRWLLTGKDRKVLLVLLCLVTAGQLISFKYCYPFPNFLPDSYSYIEVAANNKDINMWPVGYSKFLRLVSCVSRSPLFLVVVQYLLLVISALYFTTTLIYLFRLRKGLGYFLIALTVLNPLLIHTANLVASDALFASLSLLWATTLVWLVAAPEPKLMVLQALFCCLAFSVRYNALYYPFIGVVVLLLVNLPAKLKSAGILMTAGLPILFVLLTMGKYKQATGVSEFSPFGGWQLASNALYGYTHVNSDERLPPPPAFAALDRLVNRHMDSLKRLRRRPDEKPGIYYLWDPASPLKVYEKIYFAKDTATGGFSKWARMAGLYREYGSYLAKTYSAEFTRFYVLPNLLRYYVPDPEFLGIYNMKSSEMEQKGVEWFGLKDGKVKTVFSSPEVPTMNVFPVFLAIINLVYFLSLLGFLFLDGWRKSPPVKRKLLILIATLWLGNLLFSVMASPIVLRYQLFALCFTLPLCLVFIDYIIAAGFADGAVPKEKEDRAHNRDVPLLTTE